MVSFSYGGKRLLAQCLTALCQNPHIQNLITGHIYRGKAKVICAPGLNCYSCPAATLGCPLGSLQAVANKDPLSTSFYIVGIMVIFGAILGRAICGFLCLFGLVQDLLYKIPTPKLSVPNTLDKPLRFIKYGVLVVLVLVLPATLFTSSSVGTPFFCTYLCPAGTLEAGVPLLLAQKSLRSAIGGLFIWKMGIAILLLVCSIFVYRPWCKYLCPLGAFYALFNKISILKLTINHSACVACGSCAAACKMGVDVPAHPNSPECIRCGACKHACPQGCIQWNVGGKLVGSQNAPVKANPTA